ncbi:hypothetical protein AA313_de0209875 [Arthrobotrys entomopaga]|nr:hypothetical protein AA313_de0209875 [Arthrobotrys entomopaga]
MIHVNRRQPPRWWSFPMKWLSILVFITSCAGAIPKDHSIGSEFLATCMDNSQFVVSDFSFLYTPSNSSLLYGFQGMSSINSNVIISLEIIVYGYSAHTEIINPCTQNMRSLCPMQPGAVNLQLNSMNVSKFASKVPSQAFTVPDIDAIVRITFTTLDGIKVACLEAELSNGQTVHQNGVSWTTALITGSSLLISGTASALGHSKTASYIASLTLSLFGYFQSQVIFAMAAVKLPPIARSWMQNLVWSMGIIRVGFMQSVLGWYVDATGGTADLSPRADDVNVQIAKRDVQQIAAPQQPKPMIVTGIPRVAFLSGIARTNLFMTSLGFFISLVGGVILIVVIFNLSVRIKGEKKTRFATFKRDWSDILKGIIYRIILIGFPQLAALCLWELTSRDSPAIVVLAIAFFLISLSLLSWATYKVTSLGRLTGLQTDQTYLNKWGFLYTPFKSSAYFWVIPVLIYALVKGIFVGLVQSHGSVQSAALLIIESIYLIAISWVRPFTDRKINTINIFIGIINTLNAVMLVFFGISKGASLARSILGVIFFFMNAVFVLVILIHVLIAATHAIFAKDPDSRYQKIQDGKKDLKSDKNFENPTEVDSLGANARDNNQHTIRPRIGDIDGNGYSDEGTVSRAPKLPAIVIQDEHWSSNRPGRTFTMGSGSIRSSNLPTTRAVGGFSKHGAGKGSTRAQSGQQWQVGAGYDH